MSTPWVKNLRFDEFLILKVFMTRISDKCILLWYNNGMIRSPLRYSSLGMFLLKVIRVSLRNVENVQTQNQQSQMQNTNCIIKKNE